MKNLLYSFLVLSLCLSCNSEAKKVSNALLQEVDRIENEGISTNTELEKLEKELLQKTSLTDAELLRAFPKNLRELSLYEEASTAPGMPQAFGQFGKRKISLSIADAAGDFNSLATTFIGNYGLVNPSTENRKFNHIERDGIKTMSDYNAYDNETEMWLLYDNRFFISLRGDDMNPEGLWEAFDINALTGYKEMNK